MDWVKSQKSSLNDVLAEIGTEYLEYTSSASSQFFSLVFLGWGESTWYVGH
jgi:hypothetical protein